ncbi:bifunctional phosphopantothenoylcysteine decarboxylase/phosphopantothenate--cysteine ligase CoaBC [Brevibacterium linens]|uniref:Coenzyme A biosynthesis bifunctional protein CoaBC n=1 Tax=Brevibacterium linens ATCC 9172 TaxID=1255617 RepID=A0A2H1HKI3_BRELN|nr:bifunctional phosphopantothenoylcysteine decarboxylase/phosphopantothenate--cysteine ligase CoaBC [Brevibacterium linens]KAB1949573.1 bifunctional phosphopantothenoylcysteine decarboxylase/phosphopantothenate--cysteine ligase CoaBC [Brevibacterium linens ATCC 9172]SMX63376.1 phosphopantothenoylcysteine decarboxylase / phosphopantothenate--cysteine ligase [Brevibacterium linens ATCC 9172]
MRIVLGVAGGIAAYKAAHIIRRLRELDHSVKVVPTANALKFIGAPTLEALSGQTVTTDVFDEIDTVNHVRIGQEAELVIIAPATADLIAKIAAGRADDLLTASVLTTTAEVVVAPAMHTEMWLNPATVANIATLRSRGVHVLDPAVGRLTGPDSGPGRLPEPEEIVDFALSVTDGTAGDPTDAPTDPSGALSGRRIVISAGGTREALDPVRFLGNRSSGKQGVALAKAAHAAGASVELVAANIDTGLLTGLPADITVTAVESTLELQEAMHAAQARADTIIMAAAVADYRPAETTDSKMKKTGDEGLTLRLTQNPDILRGLVDERRRQSSLGRQIIVGFAAETGDADTTALDYARVKFERKGVDLFVFNDVSDDRAFGRDDTMVQIISSDHGTIVVGEEFHGSKDHVSQRVIAAVSDQFTHVESTT